MHAQHTALVVDSNPTDRARTVRLLETAGYRVRETGNFNEAKHLITHELPDVLITDLRLGPYNGLHLILRSKADHPGMAALVTSRFDDPVLQAEAQRHHAAFVLRPIADAEFLEAISHSLADCKAARAQAPARPGL
jgi:CheY-like chemotaxis protein